jgi:uncharacterized protein (TIGR00730 family)
MTAAPTQSCFSVAVFCGAQCDPGNGLLGAAKQIGRGIAERRWNLVYGGGHRGLMGALARSAVKHDGHVTAILPHHLVDSEKVEFFPSAEVVRTATMRDRKRLMQERSHAFLALPGGIGTLEELAEAMTLRQLRVHSQPIFVFDPDDFWHPFRLQFEKMIAASLVGREVFDLVEFHSGVDSVMAALACEAQRLGYS